MTIIAMRVNLIKFFFVVQFGFFPSKEAPEMLDEILWQIASKPLRISKQAQVG